MISGAGSKRLLIRASGPGLAPFGLSGLVANPKLDVIAAGGSTPQASNDNWGTPVGAGAATAAELSATFGQVGAFALPGGSNEMFGYDCRAATKDIDAIFHPPEVVEPLVRQIAAEMNLPPDWINDGVKEFVSAREARTTFPELQIPGLMITRPSPEYLLAMKCMAARLPTAFRLGDAADIKFLMRKLGITSMNQIDAIVGDFYGNRALEDGKRWLVEQLLEEVSREKKSAE